MNSTQQDAHSSSDHRSELKSIYVTPADQGGTAPQQKESDNAHVHGPQHYDNIEKFPPALKISLMATFGAVSGLVFLHGTTPDNTEMFLASFACSVAGISYSIFKTLDVICDTVRQKPTKLDSPNKTIKYRPFN
jgi:hypothetical protein